jgi:phosphoribosylaminoimidazolecarboxamide formyltransferase / IMP cyclohydrolase
MIRRPRAIISVTDKSGLIDLAATLATHNYELLASGGTAKFLREYNYEVTEISELTQFPEIFGGRVKTLHPLVFGGILGADETDFDDVVELGVKPVDLVVVNLYQFEEAVMSDASDDEIVEQIDIGGPSLLRAAAKNFKRVCVLSSPFDYAEFIENLEMFETPSLEFRQEMACRTFDRVTDYDQQISSWFNKDNLDELALQTLRYGENPHQNAEFYVPSVDSENILAGIGLEILNGKPLSYNNMIDVIASIKMITDLDGCCCTAVKHTNPCGVGKGDSCLIALEGALACDPDSAFGGIFSFTNELDLPTAELLASRFCEVILAPSYSSDAIEKLSKKKNLRVLEYDSDIFIEATFGQSRTFGSIILQQDEDDGFPELGQWNHVAGPKPEQNIIDALEFNWKICKHVKSNAIVLGNDKATLGIGAGQMSRVDSTKIAIRKAGEQNLLLKGAVCASDAFFPFADSIEQLSEIGISAIVAPGGSIRDQEVIDSANKLGITLFHTNRRHFRH